MSEWFSGGSPLDSIPVGDRGTQYADGLFETVAIRGHRPRLWSSHCDRLAAGCERLGLPMPDLQQLSAELDSAIESSAADCSFATAKIIVTAGSGPRGYRRPRPVETTVRIGIFESTPLAAETYRDGATVRVCATRLAIQPRLAGIKSLNRLEQVLARDEWDDESIMEGLMLDTEDRLICGTMSNVFIATGNHVTTPVTTRCGVDGVMRRHVVATLEQAGTRCETGDLGLDDLRRADEVFITNSQFGVVPVTRCDASAWTIGPVTRQLMRALVEDRFPECAA